MRKSRFETQELSSARGEALRYESLLPPAKRKQLGQFFTGLPLSRLLTAVSIHTTFTSVIDPMAGNGDLLDAVFERCHQDNIRLARVDALDVDVETANQCRRRVSVWTNISPQSNLKVISGSAFDPSVIARLDPDGYHLVITNPPYVRYQTTSRNSHDERMTSIDEIRSGLLQVVDLRTSAKEQRIWGELISGFSGLSDLSVPSWLLSALLVKPGGTLALVAPATWRTRDYADILQYMLARFFSLEIVISDRQPGWFSEALVRTHLVIAKRLPTSDACVPLNDRLDSAKNYSWIEISPEAEEGDSLVGAAFPTRDPEMSFASWVRNPIQSPTGLDLRQRRQSDEINQVFARCRQKRWFHKIEPLLTDAPLFSGRESRQDLHIPHPLADVAGTTPDNLALPHELGIKISQGLRTGCNDFFYVDYIKDVDGERAEVQTSVLLGNYRFTLPYSALRPVLRRQPEIQTLTAGEPLKGRVLDLRGFVLPEDYSTVKNAEPLYPQYGVPAPVVMSDELAKYVRKAASTERRKESHGKTIPQLSAVKTNVRPVQGRSGLQIPRFWYMLPDFTRRHLPDIFVPRVNHRSPSVYENCKIPVLIDANFTTIWSEGETWTATCLAAVLNSCWVRACMEAIGTPMGAGALKLEATHLRKIPLPRLSKEELRAIESLDSERSQVEIDTIVVCSLFQKRPTTAVVSSIITRLQQFTTDAKESRERR